MTASEDLTQAITETMQAAVEADRACTVWRQATSRMENAHNDLIRKAFMMRRAAEAVERERDAAIREHPHTHESVVDGAKSAPTLAVDATTEMPRPAGAKANSGGSASCVPPPPPQPQEPPMPDTQEITDQYTGQPSSALRRMVVERGLRPQERGREGLLAALREHSRVEEPEPQQHGARRIRTVMEPEEEERAALLNDEIRKALHGDQVGMSARGVARAICRNVREVAVRLEDLRAGGVVARAGELWVLAEHAD